MPSNVIIAQRICLRWPRSGNKLELLSALREICTLKRAVVMMLPPTTSMRRTASRRCKQIAFQFNCETQQNFSFKVDPNEAVACLLKAIDIYTDMGRFSMAAKHHQSIAEMYENEANDLVS